MIWTGVYQTKYYYPENIVSGYNDNRNYFHGCTCQRWGVCVRLFPYQCKAKRFYPFAGNRGNGNGYSFPCMVQVCICVQSYFSYCSYPVRMVRMVRGCFVSYSFSTPFLIHLRTAPSETPNCLAICTFESPCFFSSNASEILLSWSFSVSCLRCSRSAP